MSGWWNGGGRRGAAVLVAVATVLGVAACSDDDDGAGAAQTTSGGSDGSTPGSATGGAAPTTTTPGDLAKAPTFPVPPLLDETKVQRAVDALDGIVGHVMDETGVPGIAIAVVYKDEVVFAKGYGVRKVGAPEA